MTYYCQTKIFSWGMSLVSGVECAVNHQKQTMVNNCGQRFYRKEVRPCVNVLFTAHLFSRSRPTQDFGLSRLCERLVCTTLSMPKRSCLVSTPLSRLDETPNLSSNSDPGSHYQVKPTHFYWDERLKHIFTVIQVTKVVQRLNCFQLTVQSPYQVLP